MIRDSVWYRLFLLSPGAGHIGQAAIHNGQAQQHRAVFRLHGIGNAGRAIVVLVAAAIGGRYAVTIERALVRVMAETANHAGQRIVNAQPTGAFQHILVDFQQAQPLQIARAVIVKDSLDALPLQDAQIVRAVLLPGIALRRAQTSLQLLRRARYKIETAKIQILQRQLVGIVRAIHAVIGLGLQLRKLLQFSLSFAKGHGLILHQYLNGGDHIVLQGIHGIAYIHLIALCGIDGMLYYLRAGTIAQQAARIDRAGQLTGPLRDRFGILLKLELYSPQELGRIITRSAGILGVPITDEGALELARCARGTPRIANRLLKRARDFAMVESEGTIDEETAIAARKWMDIDELGLDELDRSLLRAIIEMYNGGPVGLETLAAALGEESVTLEDICEPYLMQMGMLTRTPRGRCVTRLAYEHLHMAVPRRFDEDNGQQSMF